MKQVSLSGQMTVTINNLVMPVRFYDNIIELTVDNYKTLQECMKAFLMSKKLPIKIPKIKKVKLVIKSKKPFIKFIGYFANLFI